MNRTTLLLVLILSGAAAYWAAHQGRESPADAMVEPSPSASESGLSAPEKVEITVPAVPPSPRKKDDPSLPLKDRLGLYRERLLAGVPIAGVAVIPSGDTAVSVPTSFTLGRQTRIELSDHSILEFTPTLNGDGSVRYAIREIGSNGSSRQLPDLIQVPWEGFSLDGGGNCLVGFDPDDMN